MSHLATVRKALLQAWPYLPMSTHLVLSALFPIYTASHASLTRPSTAAPPPKRSARDKSKKKTRKAGQEGYGQETSSDEDEDSEEEQDEDVIGRMEGLSFSDALIFPVLAGCTLGTLYLLIKYAGPALLNKLLGWYFSGMAFFSVEKLTSDGLAFVGGILWPNYYVDAGRLWKVVPREKKVIVIGSKTRGTQAGRPETRPNPLPGPLGQLSFPPRVVNMLWQARGLLGRQYIVRFHLRGVTSVKARLTLRTLTSIAFTIATLLYATFIHTPWYLTNLQGFAFSYTALQLLSPTSFPIGSTLLVALFFYDIYFVFYTPLMVSVATNLDVPIKLLIPRPADPGRKRDLAMLGLGDIVIPGLMIGMSLRFDLYMHYLKRQSLNAAHDGAGDVRKETYMPVRGKVGDRLWTTGWGKSLPLDVSSHTSHEDHSKSKTTIGSIIPKFAKPYFFASLIGYVSGMSMTLAVMGIFGHAQPALLYLVPGVLGSIWVTALVKGDVKSLLNYTELVEDDDNEDQKEQKHSDKPVDNPHKVGAAAVSVSEGQQDGWLSRFFGDSFFGDAKSERNSKRLEKAISKTFQDDRNEATRAAATSETSRKEGPKGLIGFSISPAPPRKRARKQRSADVGAAPVEGRLAGEMPDEDDDAVLIHKADAASFIDTSSSGKSRRRKA